MSGTLSALAEPLLARSIEHATPHYLRSAYGYTPTEYVCIIFVTLFAASTLLHIGQASYYRMWWLVPTAVVAGICEVIGWGGRLWSSKSPYNLTPYLIQITTTIIAPTFFTAANFVILGRIIRRLGPHYSWLSPRWYMIIFCTFDVIALIVQAVGGAEASFAAQQHKNANNGGHIMLGGIIFQMIGIAIYTAFASEFLFRYFANKPVRVAATPAAGARTPSTVASAASVEDKEADAAVPALANEPVATGATRGLTRKMKFMVFGLVFSTLVVFIRSVYRTIELADGWTGRIITTQVYFNVLDGGMITLAMWSMNIFHPGFLLS